MAIKIKQPGLFTTVQDEGRIGFQNLGFSIAGALDQYAFKIGQQLIGNNGPALECTIMGPTIEFKDNNTFVITGAPFNAQLNEISVPHQTVVKANKGDILKLNNVIEGARCYILFGKPLDIPKVANSYATHTRSQIGGFNGRTLKSGDYINCIENEYPNHTLGQSFNGQLNLDEQVTIHIVEGPQIDAFSASAQSDLTANTFTISDSSDRMGYRLKGPTISPDSSADIISEPVALGSIQVPNDGNPIILLNDKQTVGGYTKIANVCQADLNVLAQLKPGNKIQFKWITIEEATDKLIKQQQAFAKTLTAINEMPQFEMSEMRNTASKIAKLLKGE
ncbi:biotin-dependent carboxyltransferase [Staphylococcus sp. 18_1_E_LY]|uniref:Biotin-dependent carboxyltransferase n=1 Tax=Staphylococcus lloydii TaxID=2781774 RepID=A0A7T1B222_9STAP|nr:biotin-dependent carboxyltransferase family protein [Staphylococcus lloydii]MBF7018542.1 biotin-dependent carboxyltransferase [Staphylococcus lloydii]MBF7026270.1 biotin-dependent carboxyltransferase [Staphylococcus lloydii]QPM76289.1 biotin-dependent carboxyltransferase [Staphylococcus lloydii]